MSNCKIIFIFLIFLAAVNIVSAKDPMRKIQGSDFEMTAYLYLPNKKGSFPAIIALPGGRGAKEVGKVWPGYLGVSKLAGM